MYINCIKCNKKNAYKKKCSCLGKKNTIAFDENKTNHKITCQRVCDV